MASAALRSSPDLDPLRNRLATGQPCRIACIGDSITGIYYHTGSRRAYPELLEGALKRLFPLTPLSVRNAGCSGNTAAAGLERLQRDVLEHQPHLVSVMFGMNDVARTEEPLFLEHLEQIVTRSRAAGAGVLLCTPNNVRYTEGRPPEKLARYAQSIRDLAAHLAVPLADCHARFEELRAADSATWRLWMLDDIHPALDGHRLFARTIIAAITGIDLPAEHPALASSALTIAHALSRVEQQQPLQVTAIGVPPQPLVQALQQVFPGAATHVSSRDSAGRDFTALMAQADPAWQKPLGDLVLACLPTGTQEMDDDVYARTAELVKYRALPFGLGAENRDLVLVAPSVLHICEEPWMHRREAIQAHIAQSGECGMVRRQLGQTQPTAELLADFFRAQQLVRRTLAASAPAAVGPAGEARP